MRVLLVGEDENYFKPLLDGITKDFIVDVAYSSDQGEYLSDINSYDTIVVDVINTQKYLSYLRDQPQHSRYRASVVLLSKDFDSESVTKALIMGADICLPKPVGTTTLKNVLFMLRKKHARISDNTISIDGLCLDLCTKELRIAGNLVCLRKKEYEILEYLLVNSKRAVSKCEILDHVWEDSSYVLSNTVEVHIKHLRNKIEKPFGRVFIKTLRGFGYRVG